MFGSTRGEDDDPDVVVGALEFVSVVELVSDMFSVLLGTIVLFLVRRVIPRFGFLLHR